MAKYQTTNLEKKNMLICLYSVPVVDIAMLSEPSLVSGPHQSRCLLNASPRLDTKLFLTLFSVLWWIYLSPFRIHWDVVVWFLLLGRPHWAQFTARRLGAARTFVCVRLVSHIMHAGPHGFCSNFGIGQHMVWGFGDCFVPHHNTLNPLTPNVNYSGRTAPLTSKVAFYIFIQQI